MTDPACIQECQQKMQGHHAKLNQLQGQLNGRKGAVEKLKQSFLANQLPEDQYNTINVAYRSLGAAIGPMKPYLDCMPDDWSKDSVASVFSAKDVQLKIGGNADCGFNTCASAHAQTNPEIQTSKGRYL